jgi:hypothetical protein
VALLLDQKEQKLHRHSFELDRAAIAAQFIAVTVQLEFLELDHTTGPWQAELRSR